MKDNTKQLQEAADKLVELVKPLFEEGLEGKVSEFLAFLQLVLRKDLMVLSAVRFLSQEPSFGDSALALSRKVIEDLITVEYMMMDGNDKEGLTKKFHEFIPVQLHVEAEYLKSTDTNPSALKLDIKRVEEAYNKLPASVKRRRSWAGKSPDQMLDELSGSSRLDKTFLSRIAICYAFGNWKIHLNPYDIYGFYNNEMHSLSTSESTQMALAFTTINLVWMAQTYLQELPDQKHHELLPKLETIIRGLSDLNFG